MAPSRNQPRETGWWCVLIFCLWLGLGIIGCRLTQPASLPYPPGVVPSTNTQMMASVPLTVRRAVFVDPPTVTFTCDIGSGSFDGCNVYAGPQPDKMVLLQQFGPTNVFPVNLDSNWPHFIEIRTFTRWPAPYVVSCITNDDGSVFCQTNTYYEGQVADYLWVPVGMTNQWLAQMPDGSMELIGYGVQGTTYSIKHGSLNGVWQALTNFMGTNGPWIVPVTPTNATDFYLTTGGN